MIIELNLCKEKNKFQDIDSNEKITKKYLTKKRKLVKNKKNLKKNISKSKSKSIKKKVNDETQEICIICFDKISFQDKHFLHCGHNFHCGCITNWINIGKNFCPICKQNIKCILNEESNINLEENDIINVNNNSIENNINNNFNQEYNDITDNILHISLFYIFLYIPILSFLCIFGPIK